METEIERGGTSSNYASVVRRKKNANRCLPKDSPKKSVNKTKASTVFKSVSQRFLQVIVGHN